MNAPADEKLKKIAVLIPCYNESQTISKVVRDFKNTLPGADIYVYDNNSTDHTDEIARSAGAIVRHEYRQGKGSVMRSMFRDIDADVYLMADGDGSHSAEFAEPLLRPVIDGRADMTIGDRISNGSYGREEHRSCHMLGNKIVRFCVNAVFGSDIHDAMSGYRALSKRFVKNFPILSDGFEIETEMTLHALDKKFTIMQLPITHRGRPVGSVSAMNTVKDGIRVLRLVFNMFRNYRPLKFFTAVAALLALSGIYFSLPVFREFAKIKHITLTASAVLASGLEISAFTFFICGLILDSIATANRRNYALQLLHYLTEEKEKK